MLKIKDIRKKKGLTQDQASELSGIAKRSYVDYENGKSDIPFSKLQDIASAFEISVSELIGEEVKAVSRAHSPYVVTVGPAGRDNIVLVPVSARAGYLTGYDDPQFIERLPAYSLPQINHGIFRMFQVSGQSMVPTIHDKSIVVGQFVENWVDDIKDNRVYVVVSQDEGIIIKRCLNRLNKYGHLYCKSDNRKEYPNITLEAHQIQEVWEVKMLMAFELMDPADLYDRVSDLEAEIMSLKGKIG